MPQDRRYARIGHRHDASEIDGVVAGGSSGGIPTVPTSGNFPVMNLSVDSATGNLIVEYEDTGGASAFITSTPTTGNFRVTNLYVDASSGRLIVEYDDGT